MKHENNQDFSQVRSLKPSYGKNLDYGRLRIAVSILGAVNHRLRQRIVDLLQTEENMTIEVLSSYLKMEEHDVRNHIHILQRAKVIISEKRGKKIYYRANYMRLEKIQKFVFELNNF